MSFKYLFLLFVLKFSFKSLTKKIVTHNTGNLKDNGVLVIKRWSSLFFDSVSTCKIKKPFSLELNIEKTSFGAYVTSLQLGSYQGFYLLIFGV